MVCIWAREFVWVAVMWRTRGRCWFTLYLMHWDPELAWWLASLLWKTHVCLLNIETKRLPCLLREYLVSILQVAHLHRRCFSWRALASALPFCLKICLQGLERWLISYEHLLLLQRISIQLPVSLWWLTTIHCSNSRGAEILWLLWAPGSHMYTDIHADKTQEIKDVSWEHHISNWAWWI